MVCSPTACLQTQTEVADMGTTYPTPNGGASVMNGTSNTQNNNTVDRGLLKAANDKAANDKALANKLTKRRAQADKDAAINADTKRQADRAELETARMADFLEKERGSNTTTQNTNEGDGGLLGSFMPKVISESLKGDGNYDPNWVNKNKAAGAKHLENLSTTGQIQRGRSNITDKNGNAIGGVVNSEDNTAMQEMAANGVKDPLSTLSSKVSDEAGLDTSLYGAFKQTMTGADGYEYEGGGGLLKYSQENDTANQVDGFTEAERFGDSNEFAKVDTAARDTSMANGVQVDELSSSQIDILQFSGNLGFADMQVAQKFWDSMTPEAQAIFKSKENPQAKDSILASVFGMFIPGFGLLNEFSYNDSMTLQEKLEYANRTAVSVANNKRSNTGDGDNGGDNGGGNDSVDVVEETPAGDYNVKYSSVKNFTDIFGQPKF